MSPVVAYLVLIAGSLTIGFVVVDDRVPMVVSTAAAAMLGAMLGAAVLTAGTLW